MRALISIDHIALCLLAVWAVFFAVIQTDQCFSVPSMVPDHIRIRTIKQARPWEIFHVIVASCEVFLVLGHSPGFQDSAILFIHSSQKYRLAYSAIRSASAIPS